MSVRERILAIRLAERIGKDPNYAGRLGIEVQVAKAVPGRMPRG